MLYEKGAALQESGDRIQFLTEFRTPSLADSLGLNCMSKNFEALDLTATCIGVYLVEFLRRYLFSIGKNWQNLKLRKKLVNCFIRPMIIS